MNSQALISVLVFHAGAILVAAGIIALGVSPASSVGSTGIFIGVVVAIIGIVIGLQNRLRSLMQQLKDEMKEP